MKINMNTNFLNYIMLVGLPASGKSSWAKDYILKNQQIDFQILSTDEIIEKKALHVGIGYREAHEKYIHFAINEMERKFWKYIENGVNIIHDQTNVSIKVRMELLAKVTNYSKTAVVFKLGEKEWGNRFEKRRKKTGKDIPNFVIKNMMSSFEYPTKEEGFDDIIIIQD